VAVCAYRQFVCVTGALVRVRSGYGYAMLCAVTGLASADLHSLIVYIVCGCMRLSSVCVCDWCSCQGEIWLWIP